MGILITSDSVISNLIAAINAQTAAISKQTTAINSQTASVSNLTAILQQIVAYLNPQPVKITIQFGNQEPGMPIQITDSGAGSSTIASASEVDAAGNPVTIDPTTITFAVSDPTAFTLTPNQTTSPIQGTDGSGAAVTINPGSCQYKAIGTSGHTGAFQATVTDSKNNLNAQDTITVVSGAATSLVIGFTPAS